MRPTSRLHDLGGTAHDILTAIFSWLAILGLEKLAKEKAPWVRYGWALYQMRRVQYLLKLVILMGAFYEYVLKSNRLSRLPPSVICSLPKSLKFLVGRLEIDHAFDVISQYRISHNRPTTHPDVVQCSACGRPVLWDRLAMASRKLSYHTVWHRIFSVPPCSLVCMDCFSSDTWELLLELGKNTQEWSNQ